MPSEMKAPPRAVPRDDNGYFEILTMSVFQSGFRWSVVEAKWPNFRQAFAGFDIDTVAGFGPPDVDRLVADEGIIRNARKIEGTIANAGTLRDLVSTHGAVKEWLDTTADMPWPARKKAVAEPFKYFGPFGAYFFLWSVGEAVPPHDQQEDWDGPVPPGSPESLA
jgi:DNA-3-methyladenine glycosylase I